MSDIVWEDPPATTAGRPGGRWGSVLDALKARPGEWARIAVRPTSGRAASIVTGIKRRRGFDAAVWEFKTRLIATNEFAVYARYMPKL